MDTLRYDVRHALRAMSRQPVTSLIVVLTLALRSARTPRCFPPFIPS